MRSKLKIGMEVYHEKLYWGHELMKIVGIRKTTEDESVLLEGDWSGGTHAVCQRGWMPIKGLLCYRKYRI